MSTKSHIAANKHRLIVSALLGFIAGSLIMYVSWQHNPQCEIHCEGTVYWGYWLALGLSACVLVFLAVFGLVWAFNYVKNT